MSRLFEALSDEEIKRGLLKIVPRAGASSSAVEPDTNAGTTVSKEPVREDVPVQGSSASVSGAAARPETVSPSIMSPEAPPSVPILEIEKEKPLQQGPAWKFVSPAVATQGGSGVASASPESTEMAKELAEVSPKQVNILDAHPVQARVSPDSRLVAFTNPNTLGAEKFRALVTRLDHLRKQREMKSIQVTSSVINEGKTLVASNLAVTLAKYLGAKTLLVEGDLHRPTLAALFGLNELPGLTHWWSGSDPELARYVCKLEETPLWILPAGKPCNRPSDIISSARFAKAFAQMAGKFEWIVVDSTPMLPIVDANLWSRLVDGTLLVVREDMAPVKALKKGLQALDSPKLIGIVLNEVSGTDQVKYANQYYGSSTSAAEQDEKM
jgi:capsular exopolysaccharide synthesis family protein